MKLRFAVVLQLVLVSVALAQSPGRAAQDRDRVGTWVAGTVTALEAEQGKITVRTDAGQAVTGTLPPDQDISVGGSRASLKGEGTISGGAVTAPKISGLDARNLKHVSVLRNLAIGQQIRMGLDGQSSGVIRGIEVVQEPAQRQ